ncbi:dTDP-4-dehydrorhamnose 3,5-epimerase [Paenibacillus thiaminolyticus]|uniref:dTDP-4-dehydrorhamnose 3,5-epimerase n=1 Tax=Paenibacillus thiaminolyticus TaxID=49283 RepID=A0A3A3H124_PANTH|nr:dTDP-4-dehydrorhamnose 3,5-epimerase [Paenibacillus thiaminolyticus]RJG24771.1 dTDP-4-dehydrorhamnose 3,5-epimerase [Paenibacillus thiaminolyticus]
MKVIDTKLKGLRIIEQDVYRDHRGVFVESYSAAKFSDHQIDYCFVQDNCSLSVKGGVVRGLHYQLNPKAQTKLVYVVSGEIYDVAVDIRKNSPTYGQWVGVILSDTNHKQLLIPKGFAHGYCTLAPNTVVVYKVDEVYSPEHERGIYWNDPALGINWPVKEPILSEKDQLAPLLGKSETNFIFSVEE